MWHAILITLHATAAVTAFVAGCLASRKRAYFTLYFWSLDALVLFLAAVVALDCPGLDATSRVLFIALVGLGGYMTGQAVEARRLRPVDGPEQSVHVIDHVGFTLIALFDGFVVILTLDLGAPAWLAVAAAAAGVVVGRAAIASIKRPVASRSAPLDPATSI